MFSSLPLTASLASSLHQVAYELYRRDEGVGQVIDQLVHGTVRNLKKDVLLGAIGGPVFEADLETERGAGMVRFLLTRQGIDLMAAREPPPSALN